MKKSKLIILSTLLISLFTGCGNSNNEVTSEVISSELRGTFTNKEDIETQFKKQITDGDYLYSTFYPTMFMQEDQVILYRIDQKLVLKRNYTYNYEYSIILGNPGGWGNLEVSKLYVNISGTFDYKKMDKEPNSYVVNLSNPTSGREEIYGSYLYNTQYLSSWVMHTSPDLVLNFDELTKFSDYQFDNYVKGRKVIVTKATDQNEDNKIEDDVFYPFIIDDIAKYSTY